MKTITDYDFSELRRVTDERISAIRGCPGGILPSGNTYYISNAGSDDADGRSPLTAWATLDRVNAENMPRGSVVLFKRGDMWRGQLTTSAHVAYSAYGSGKKPLLCASPENASGSGKWIITDAPDVYRFYRRISDDCGTIVFDGSSCAIKCVIRTESDGSTFNNTTGDAFSAYGDLFRDLHFYHDLRSGDLYLCSKSGNPSERFSEIELNVKRHVIAVHENGVTVDNLCVKYGGAHGIGAGTVSDLTVTNCEFGWIGGSIQAEGIFGRNYGTRYGNAVEIYGGCKNYRVANCYFYQIYDAAVTQQMNVEETPVVMENIAYENNVMEFCNYSVEYFLSKTENTPSYIKNFRIRGNLMWNAGQGFCEQRPDLGEAAHIKSWSSDNPASDYIIEGNLFCLSRDNLLHICARDSKSLPEFERNSYIQYENGSLAVYGESKTPDRLKFKNAGSDITQILRDPSPVIETEQ